MSNAYPSGFSVPSSAGDSSLLDTLSGAESISSLSAIRGRAVKRSKSIGTLAVPRPAAPAPLTGASGSTEYFALTDLEQNPVPPPNAQQDLFTRILAGARAQHDRANAAEAEIRKLKDQLSKANAALDTTKELAAQWVSSDGDQIGKLQDALDKAKSEAEASAASSASQQRELLEAANRTFELKMAEMQQLAELKHQEILSAKERELIAKIPNPQMHESIMEGIRRRAEAEAAEAEKLRQEKLAIELKAQEELSRAHSEKAQLHELARSEIEKASAEAINIKTLAEREIAARDAELSAREAEIIKLKREREEAQASQSQSSLTTSPGSDPHIAQFMTGQLAMMEAMRAQIAQFMQAQQSEMAAIKRLTVQAAVNEAIGQSSSSAPPHSGDGGGGPPSPPGPNGVGRPVGDGEDNKPKKFESTKRTAQGKGDPDDDPPDDDNDDEQGWSDEDDDEDDGNEDENSKFLKTILKAGKDKEREMLIKGGENFKVASFPEQASAFRAWKLNVRHACSSACKQPEKAVRWLNRVDERKFEELKTSGKIWKSVDMRLAAALQSHAKGQLGRKINAASEKAFNENSVLKGRQMLKIIYDHFETDEAYGHINDITDLMSMRMKDPKNINQLRPFIDNWHHVLDGLRNKPSIDMLQVMFYERVKDIPQLSQEIGIYDRARYGEKEKTYEWLMEAVERLLKRRHLEANRNSIKNNLNATEKPAAPGPKVKAKSKAKAKARSSSEPRGRGRSKSRGGDKRNKSTGDKGNDNVCRAWKNNGKCPRGKDCKYDRPPDKKGKSRSPSGAKKCKNGPSCKFLKDGKCKFDHSADKPAAPAPKKKPKKKNKDKEKGDDDKSGK